MAAERSRLRRAISPGGCLQQLRSSGCGVSPGRKPGVGAALGIRWPRSGQHIMAWPLRGQENRVGSPHPGLATGAKNAAAIPRLVLLPQAHTIQAHDEPSGSTQHPRYDERDRGL